MRSGRVSPYARGIVWLRRDLRLDDNVALHAAQRACDDVCLAFVVDPALLRGPRMGAPLTQCFFSAVGALRAELRVCGSDLAVLEDENSGEAIAALAKRLDAGAVFYSVDYEPYAIARDTQAERLLRGAGIDVHASVDHVYFGADEILQRDGSPYRIFTAYRRQWMDRYTAQPRPPLRTSKKKFSSREAVGASRSNPEAAAFGFETSANFPEASETAANKRLQIFARSSIGEYDRMRDVPAMSGTSQLSPQLRAGTIGIRRCAAAAENASKANDMRAGAQMWLSELVWRDFYQMILKHFPRVAEGPFLERGEHVRWRRADSEFDAWCEGRTGYPIVDAAMRQLNTYGWMHNRLRMIVASFLTKDLLIDWRRGERYFEHRLADADLAANNGGWQWSASTGTDAVPYFRLFNPVLQAKKFDPDGTFVRSMLPELRGLPDRYIHAPWEMPPIIAAGAGVTIGKEYPEPIVDHAVARERALDAYAAFKR
jgi:deoxyribodipyrimidine photo-lyase